MASLASAAATTQTTGTTTKPFFAKICCPCIPKDFGEDGCDSDYDEERATQNVSIICGFKDVDEYMAYADSQFDMILDKFQKHIDALHSGCWNINDTVEPELTFDRHDCTELVQAVVDGTVLKISRPFYG